MVDSFDGGLEANGTSSSFLQSDLSDDLLTGILNNVESPDSSMCADYLLEISDRVIS